MEIISWTPPIGNFGDDLNKVVWKSVFSESAMSASDVVLAGIGSILDEGIFSKVAIEGKQGFVLGTGAGLGPLPKNLDKWEILSVRGPLTAQLLSRPELAVTDGAILLAAVPDLVRQQPRRDAVLFIPHFETVEHCDWAAISAEAGLEFVDPQWPVGRVLDAYSRAKLVLAEAMHGVIVADTLRIPWIPLLISPKASIFKWKDWTNSMELPLNFASVPPGSSRLMLRQWRITRNLRSAGYPIPKSTPLDAPNQHYVSDFNARYASRPVENSKTSNDAGKVAELKRFFVAFGGKAASPIMTVLDRRYDHAAVRSLQHVIKREAYLSSDAVFDDRLSRTLGLVQLVEKHARQ